MDTIPCPSCGFPLPANFTYCPQCGHKRAETSLSLVKQINVYLLSVLLPPFGLIPGIKYVLSPEPKIQRVGVIVLILTVIATIVTIWIAIATYGQLTQMVNSQVQQYQILNQ